MDIANFKPTTTQDLVGFLPVNEALHFAGGRFEPIPNLAEVFVHVAEVTNADHFVYPPTVYTAKGSSFNKDEASWTEVPKTKRPVLLHRLPPSHFLRLDERPANGDLRSADGAFLNYAVGYVFGYRMQFYDWWFDGRIQMKSAHHAYVSPNKASSFLEKAYSSWRSWKPLTQKRFTNALYMLRRGPSYEWEWEQFTIYYMVFDTLYRTASEIHGVSAVKHPGRLAAMCQYYGLFQDKTLFSRITKLRGDLFHEALWAGGQPGSSPTDDSWSQVGNLQRICERLVPAIVGFKTNYVATPWNSIGTAVF